MSMFIFSNPKTSWFGQTGTVNCIIESTREHLDQSGTEDFRRCIVDMYRPLDVEGQVFIDLSNADIGCFNYFYAMCQQAMLMFPESPWGMRVDPPYVEVIVNTWKQVLEFLREDERFDKDRVARIDVSLRSI